MVATLLSSATMFNLDDVKTIHLELTDKCNAHCPQCARNQLGGPANPYLPNRELSLNDIQIILPKETVLGLNYIYACGNYGDPIVGKETLEIFRYLRECHENLKLSMNTNASYQDEKWWSELASIIAGKGDVKFGVDGLSDTNHLYRQGTNFEKIMANAQAFIDAGGKAIWEFIIFKHNEHQVDQARALALKMGFHTFRAKKTGRFFSNTKLQGKERQEVRDRSGEVTHYLEKPTARSDQNKSLLGESELIKEFGSMENYIDQAQINCKTLNEGSIYISSEGAVFPCCWTANQLYLWYMPQKSGAIWNMIKDSGGLEAINAKSHALNDILTGPFFRLIESSWNKNSIKEGKTKVCAKTCGLSFDQYRDQYR